MTDIEGNLSVNNDDAPYILQICHCYYDPFLDCARQFSAIFKGTKYRIVTVFMTGEPDDAVAKAADSDEVIFLGHSSKKLRGLKLQVCLLYTSDAADE